MKLHCLGTAGYHPNQQRHTSCYFLPAVGIVLDAGTGMFRLPPLVETDHLDVFLSHAHADHVIGLTYLLDVLYQKPVKQVRIWGDGVKLQAIQQHLFSEYIFPVELKVVWSPLQPQLAVPLSAGGTLTPFELEHPGGSLGFRMDWPQGPSIAYVTDTTAKLEAPYVRHLHGCDLLLHECNFRDEQCDWADKTGHSCTSGVAQVAAASQVKELLLTHINPLENSDDPVGIESARKIFANTRIAQDEMCIRVGAKAPRE